MKTTLDKRTIKALKPRGTAYYVTDLAGLQLRVGKDGTKTWNVRYRVGARRVRLTLGDALAIPLNDEKQSDGTTLTGARTLAKRAASHAASGTDPALVKKQRKAAKTVQDVVTEYLVWAKKHKRSWGEDRRRLEKSIVPIWKHRPLDTITRRDIKQLLASIEAPFESNRTHAVISKLLSYALDEEIIAAHPMMRMRKAHAEASRDRVLSHDELRTFWTACDTLDAPMSAYWKLRLLTAQRGKEVETMSWNDIDIVSGWWTIPASIAKNKLAHRVPLSPTALQIVKALRTDVDAALQLKRDAGKPATEPTYVCQNARGKRQHRIAARAFGIPDFRGHDLRRTAASLMAGSGTTRLTISKILNHVESGITAVYDRHGYDHEKRVALIAWDTQLAGILTDKPGTVLPFAKRG